MGRRSTQGPGQGLIYLYSIMPCGSGARNPRFLAKLNALPACFFCDLNVRIRMGGEGSLTESVGVIGPAGLLRGRAGPNRISHSAFRQSHRGVALGWRWGRSRVEHRAKILCLRWEEQCHCACDHSYHTREPTNGRPGRSMLVGVRLTPRAYVSPAAIQAPARRSVSNSIASGGPAEGDPLFAAICSQAKANGARLVPAAAGYLFEPHVCARAY